MRQNPTGVGTSNQVTETVNDPPFGGLRKKSHNHSDPDILTLLEKVFEEYS